MKTKTIKKAIVTVSIISIIGFAGYAFADMGFGSRMGGYTGEYSYHMGANGHRMMNGLNGHYQDHMGENGRYACHVDNWDHMYNHDFNDN